MSHSLLPLDVSPAFTERDILERVGRLGGYVRHRLAANWTGPGALETVCSYAVSARGKFFRPILLMESAGAVGCDVEPVLPAAAGIEGAHVACLMHDDIIDGDTMRRGLPAVHVRFGRDDAIVGGDALIFYLFGALAACGPLGVPDHRIVAAMAEAAQAGTDLCRGQFLEEEIRRTYDCRISSYLTMIQGKTGALFRASCKIGAILGGGTEAEAAALGNYGRLLGFAILNALNNDASILYGLGGGRFAPGQRMPLGGPDAPGVDGAEGLQLIDFNGDGHLDMAVTQMITNRLMVFQGNGRGQFTPAGSYGVTFFPEDLLAGDFDGDGCQDLAVPGNLPPIGPADVGVARVSVLLNLAHDCAPTAVVRSVQAAVESDAMTLRWQPPLTKAADITGYSIVIPGVAARMVPATARETQLTGLPSSLSTFQVRITAVNASGYATPPAEITVRR